MAEIVAQLEKAEVVARLIANVRPTIPAVGPPHQEAAEYDVKMTAEFGLPMMRPDGVKQWIFKNAVSTVWAQGYEHSGKPPTFGGTILQWADVVWGRLK